MKEMPRKSWETTCPWGQWRQSVELIFEGIFPLCVILMLFVPLWLLQWNGNSLGSVIFAHFPYAQGLYRNCFSIHLLSPLQCGPTSPGNTGPGVLCVQVSHTELSGQHLTPMVSRYVRGIQEFARAAVTCTADWRLQKHVHFFFTVPEAGSLRPRRPQLVSTVWLSLGGLSPWPVDGRLLALFSHGLSSVRTHPGVPLGPNFLFL